MMNFGTMSKHTMCLCSTPGASHHKSGSEACHCCGHYTRSDTCHGKCPPPDTCICTMSLITSQPSPLPDPLLPDSGGDMPDEWRGSDALHAPSPGGSTLLLYMVGLPLSLPPLTFPPSIECAGVLVVVLGQFCSKLRLLCYAPILL